MTGWEIAQASALGLSVGSNAFQAYLSSEAGQEAKEQGRINAQNEAALTLERTRIMKEENERRESYARAIAAASGLSGASSELYINALEESGRADIDWLNKVGATAYSAALDAGDSAYSQAQQAMWGSIGNSTTSGILIGALNK
jgi:ElaB/YqjD/DUF883 family membrane-anchored ribosome-binding protein